MHIVMSGEYCIPNRKKGIIRRMGGSGMGNIRGRGEKRGLGSSVASKR